MRPITLTMTAFGPYKGTEIVDFRELKDMNLFLITGPTGAGKTTIFDAISFAIYGEASGNMRSADHLRSHFAEEETLTEVALEFELKGVKYHIHRIPKQNKPKARGEGTTEQKPEATLTLYEGAVKTVVAGVKSVNDKIEAILGINAEQFKQIMMIPQGEFQKLLTAGSEERQRVLQQLFDTAIYNTLQMRLESEAKNLDATIKKHRDLRDDRISRIECDAETPLQLLIEAKDKAIGEILALTDAQMKQDQIQIAHVTEAMSELSKKMEQKIEAREKAKASNEKLELRDQIKTELDMAEQASSEIAMLENRVNLAERAWVLAPLEETLRLRKLDCESKTAESSQLVSKIEAAQTRAKQAEAFFLEASSPEKVKQREAFVQELTRLRSYEGKVARLESLTRSVAERETHCNQVELKQRSVAESIATAHKKLNELRQDATLAKDAAISAAAVKERLNKLTDEGKRLKKLIELQADVAKEADRYKSQELVVKTLSEKVEATQLDYKKKRLDWLKNQAAVLAKDLQEGEACPVCGSNHHPAVAVFSNTPVTEEALNGLEQRLKKLEEDYNRENNALGICENQLKTLKLAQTDGLKELDEETQQKVQQSDLESLIEEKRAEAMGVKKELLALEQRASRYEDLAKAITTLNDEAMEAEKKAVALTTEHLKANKELSEDQAALKLIFEEVPEAIRNLVKLAEAIRTQESLQKEAAESYEQAQKYHETSKSALLELQAYQQQLTKDLVVLREMAEAAAQAMAIQIEASAFENEAAYLSAKLPQETLMLYRNQIEQHAKTCHALKIRLAELMQQTQNLHQVNIDIFEQEIAQLKLQSDEQIAYRSSLERKVDNNLTLIKEIDDLQKQMGDQEVLYRTLGHLANVAKGNNTARITFERYVLAAFLEDILVAANIRLGQMTSGRYKLSRTEELQRSNAKGGLELEVYDHYTGKSRHVKTLSGGEGFKASLAMALGLADVVQAYAGGVQLDTMFIDEGFGTLDQESLDSAISCLIDLQKTGRLVGIISHVQELKERMDARLEVHSTSFGSATKFVVN